MITIIDNDVIFKLAKWDLLGELTTLLGGDHRQIHHLPTCVHALCGRPARMRKTGCDEVTAVRIREFCGMTCPLHDQADSTTLELLAGVPGIDAGEVQIFAVASTTPDSLSYLGDKRSLVALCSMPPESRIAELLSGRVKCLEQVMGELMLQEGAAAVGMKVLACDPAADMAITISFKGHPGMRDETEIWVALQSYYQDLRNHTGKLLAPFPVAPRP